MPNVISGPVTASDTNLYSFRSPVSVLLLLGEAPHVEVGLHRLGSQDVVRLLFIQCHRLREAREVEGLGSKLGGCGEVGSSVSGRSLLFIRFLHTALGHSIKMAFVRRKSIYIYMF